MPDVIRDSFLELNDLIISHSNYPIDWLLRQPYEDFFKYIDLIEKDLKRKNKK